METPSRRRPHPWHPPATFPSPITTPRLLLRPPSAADRATLRDLLDVHGDAVRPWMTWTGAAPDDDPAALVVVDVADDRVIGAGRLHDLDPATASAALEGWVAAPWTRRGLATEALRHVLSTALRPQRTGGWGLNRVHLSAPGADRAARGVAGALGLRREVRRRQHTWVDGVGVDDCYGWGVLADEWDVEAMRMVRDDPDPDVGVGPHPHPWPDDDRFDPALLRDGDRRNVADRYRWWRHDAIVDDLAARANPFHVAIENWRHDNNIGTVVRNANAFGAAAVHVVGRRSWNRRGAMVTDRYLAVHHHPDVAALSAWAAGQAIPLVGVDNLPGSVSVLSHPPPARCVLLLGQEGPGLSAAARQAVTEVLHIPQFGSTRSINAGVASGIAMAAWVRAHRPDEG